MLCLVFCFSVSLCLFSYVTSIWPETYHKSHALVLDSMKTLGMINQKAIDLMKKFDRYDFMPHNPSDILHSEPSPTTWRSRSTTKSPQEIAAEETSMEYTSMNMLILQHGQSLQAMYKWLKPGAKCLDIGSGTGYVSACMAEMVGRTGKVYGIERIPYIMQKSIEAIKIHHAELFNGSRLKFISRDGLPGLPEKGPFDVIHLGGTVENDPIYLMSQLKQNGCLIAPVGPKHDETQMLRRFIKYNDTSFKVENISETVQTPLLTREELMRRLGLDTPEFDHTRNSSHKR